MIAIGNINALSIDNPTVNPDFPKTTDSVMICANVDGEGAGITNVELSCSSLIHTLITEDMTGTSGDYCTEFYISGFQDNEIMSCEITAEDDSPTTETLTVPDFTYDGLPPTIINSNGPYSGNEGTNVPLSASGSDTVDMNLDYLWDLDNNNIYETSGQNTNFICLDDSVNTINVKAIDDAGFESIDETTVTCDNVAPVAEANGAYSVSEGSSVQLTGSATDVPADILNYAWDLDNNGTYETIGQNPMFLCSVAETYNVGLRVTDDDEGVGIDTTTINCGNAAPVINSMSVSPTSINEGQLTTLTASFSDTGDTNLNYEINWGDGSTTTTGSTSDGTISKTHQYMDDDADDKYTITLTVTDSDSASTIDTKEFIVNNLAPWNINAGKDQNSAIGDEIQFFGNAEDVAGDTLIYNWDFGDSTSSTEQNPIHIYYTARGTYTVILTVSDEDGGVSTDTLTIIVLDYKLQLNSGWNLISIPLVPEEDNTSINYVFGDEIIDNAEIVWSYQNGQWKYNTPLSDGTRWTATSGRIQNIIPGYGYYIKMDNEVTSYKNGERMYDNDGFTTPKPPFVTLTPSWNLIGHYGMVESLTKDLALTTLGGRDSTLLDNNGIAVSTMNPTEGYWLFITGTGNVDYAPSNDAYN